MITAGVIAAAFLLMLTASTLSRAASIKRSLKPFIGRTARVSMWGAVPDESPFVIDSVSSFGVGLIIWLRREPSGAKTMMKVAQPTEARISPTRIEITDARYVQWGRRKGAAGVKTSPAVVLTLTS